MRDKDQPPVRAGIGINGLLDGVKIVPALLDENALIIQVHLSGVVGLPATASAFVSGDYALGLETRPS